jgi:nitroreductase
MKSIDKKAQTLHDLHPVLINRWSPRAFDEKAVEKVKIERMFEAARWSPSASNEQPWRFIVGIKGDETYQKIFDTFVEFNQLWAITAPVLVLSVGYTKSLKNPGQNNPTYTYDVGQAVAHLSFQAHADGLHVHQMAGFDVSKAELDFNVPADYKVLTALAVGYIGDPEILHPNLKVMEYDKRERRPAAETVFSGSFGNAYK